MAFIRKKKINGKEYGYLVQNKWTDKGSRQKARYLGKVLTLPIKEEISFEEYLRKNYNESMSDFIRKHSKVEIVTQLIIYELIKRGFSIGEVEFKKKNLIGKWEKKKEALLTDGIYYYKGRRLYKKSTHKEVLLELNEGFLCRFSTDRLLRASITGYDEREKGIKLAQVLLEAGLKVDKEVFVLLFGKFS